MNLYDIFAEVRLQDQTSILGLKTLLDARGCN